MDETVTGGDDWDAVWADVGVVITPAPAPLHKAAWLYRRDGYLGAEARELCAMYRLPTSTDVDRG